MKVFYMTDVNGTVEICCDWNEQIEPDENWKVADIEAPAYESHGVSLYKEVDGEVVPRTAEEISADVAMIPTLPPTPFEMLRADVDYILMLLDEE